MNIVESGKKAKITFEGKEIMQIESWSLKGLGVPLEELFGKSKSIEFSGTFDPIEPSPIFEVGEVYDIIDYQTGMKGKAKCISKNENDYQFKIIGNLRKNQRQRN